MKVGFEVIKDYYQERKERRQRIRDILFIIFCLGLIVFAVVGCNQKPVWAGVVDLNTIRTIESSGNPLAVSPTGACGLHQIMPCVLQEYNTFNKTNYSRPDLFNPQINTIIAKWYLDKRIPQMLRHYGKEVNTRNCLIAYNAGIGAVVKGYLPKETANYLKKYARLTQ